MQARATSPDARGPELSASLGRFDATMLVMGGIVGAGIFANPSVVARLTPSAPLILGAWLAGGVIALAGGFIYAELAARLPKVGGQYAYIREAYHPLVAFVYGWTLLLVTVGGGMAAVAVTFARYATQVTGLAVPDAVVAPATLAVLTAVNCLGVRIGGTLQTTLMVIKIGAVLLLVVAGLAVWHAPLAPPVAWVEGAGATSSQFLAALSPVLFAYGGWQTTSFVAGEIRNPARTLPLAVVAGVLGVVALYLLVNLVCVAALGVSGLAATGTPASDVMGAAFGDRGARLIAAGIAVSTLGFLSQNILTAPRVYFAMARDGVFFKRVGRVHPTTRVPVLAIVLQGTIAAVIAVSGTYDRILAYVVSVDWIFFGLTGAALLVLRRRQRDAPPPPFVVRGATAVVAIFTAAAALVVVSTVATYPRDTVVGLALLATGVPVYYLWRGARSSGPAETGTQG